jgi:hypothetical protein
LAAKKRQNRITEYRLMLQEWREAGAITCAGYIIGFPGDTKASILHDVEIIKRSCRSISWNSLFSRHCRDQRITKCFGIKVPGWTLI